MTTVQDIYDFLDELAPFAYQESYDNAGLIVGDRHQEVIGIMVSLDTTEAVVMDAVANGCNVIVSHHPIIFGGLKSITSDYYVHRAVIAAIKHDVSIIAIHTNLDNVLANGVNECIAQRLGLQNISILKPNKKWDREGNIGAGVLAQTAEPIPINDFLTTVKLKMNVGCLKHTKLIHTHVSKVAICGGSGSFLIDAAIANDADIYITSDVKYHEYFDANDNIIIADIGHYESEQYTVQLLHKQISQKFCTFATHCTNVNTNPVNYL